MMHNFDYEFSLLTHITTKMHTRNTHTKMGQSNLDKKEKHHDQHAKGHDNCKQLTGNHKQLDNNDKKHCRREMLHRTGRDEDNEQL